MAFRRTTALAVVVAGAVGGLVWVGGAGAAAQPTVLTAELSGENEPEGGVGSGTARLTLNADTGRVCFTIRLRGVGTTAAGHIHRGGANAAGPVVVPLYGEATRRPRGCVRDQEAAVLRRIIRRPGRYYVNVHTADYPDGAARGQLQEED
jgi:hypothetical protein